MRRLGLLLLTAACASTHPERASIWVPYVHRGVLHRVRADGSDGERVRERVSRGNDLYDMWQDPVPRPGGDTIAVIRERNRSFNVFPDDPLEFDQSWELVLVDGERNEVLYTTREELSLPRWSHDGRHSPYLKSQSGGEQSCLQHLPALW